MLCACVHFHVCRTGETAVSFYTLSINFTIVFKLVASQIYFLQAAHNISRGSNVKRPVFALGTNPVYRKVPVEMQQEMGYVSVRECYSL